MTRTLASLALVLVAVTSGYTLPKNCTVVSGRVICSTLPSIGTWKA